MLTQEIAEARVANGVKLLNSKFRGWKPLIKQPVDIARFDRCIGGQLDAAKLKNFFSDVLDCDAQNGVDGGFDLAHDEVSPKAYETLTEAWNAVL